MKKLFKLLFSRLFFGGIFILLQVAVMVLTLYYFSDTYAQVQTVFTVLSVIAVLYIVNQEGSSAFKIAWILPIVFLPALRHTALLPLRQEAHPGAQARAHKRHGPALQERDGARCWSSRGGQTLGERGRAYCSRRIWRMRRLPRLHADGDDLLPLGDELFPAMLEELEKAGEVHLHGVLHNRARRDVGLHPRRAQAQGRRGRGRAG